MLASWALVSTELSGGIDVGVLAVGASVAAAVAGGFAAAARVRTWQAVGWTLLAFAVTFGAALTSVLLLIAALGSIPFSPPGD